ncbi:MAG: hypothetical protein VXZ96_18105 [Myxococcota bacterium]|nr:hypothetical protein [Myxococcota bacterium]
MITSHEDGSEFLEGVSSQFRAQATDDDDLGETLMVTWYVDDEVVCDSALAEADGSSFCDIAFGPEATRVIVNVSDPNNGGASDEISIVVTLTDAPAVSIIAPHFIGNFHQSDWNLLSIRQSGTSKLQQHQSHAQGVPRRAVLRPTCGLSRVGIIG